MKEKLLSYIIKEFYNGVTSEDVLEVMYQQIAPDKVVATGIKVGDKLLTPVEIMQLKQEAEMIKETKLWKLLRDRMQYHAQVRLSRDANKDDDVLLPKYIIWTLQAQQEVLNVISAFEQKAEQSNIVGKDGSKIKKV
jgi:hypothetical protein